MTKDDAIAQTDYYLRGMGLPAYSDMIAFVLAVASEAGSTHRSDTLAEVIGAAPRNEAAPGYPFLEGLAGAAAPGSQYSVAADSNRTWLGIPQSSPYTSPDAQRTEPGQAGASLPQSADVPIQPEGDTPQQELGNNARLGWPSGNSAADPAKSRAVLGGTKARKPPPTAHGSGALPKADAWEAAK